MIGVLGFASAFFLIGIIQHFGYTGTTPIHPITLAEWKSFKSKFIKTSLKDTIPGSPYYLVDGEPEKTTQTVKFDARLTQILQYLAKDKSGTDAQTCGTNRAHESLSLSNKSPVSCISDLSHPSTSVRSSSTVCRGVGLRIVSADRIKCTKVCYTTTPPTVTAFNPPGFEIPLGIDDVNAIKADLPVPADCQVYCAVDYYPIIPTDITPRPEELVPPLVNNKIKLLDPSVLGGFLYQEPFFSEAVEKAAIYKTAQIAYELMNVDSKNCDSSSGNVGNKRKIPYTVIFPNWVHSSSEFSDNDMPQFFLNEGKKEFPFNLQVVSPLAGETYDPALNTIGLHFNY